MISIIIPTLWKDPTCLDRIKLLSNHDLVGEIILIDNTDEGLDFGENIPKLKHIKEFKNTFVNPAWNKGVRLAEYDKLLFLSDDVDTDFSILDMVYDYITDNIGMIGAGVSCWNPHYVGGQPLLVPINQRQMCYAAFFFMHKNSYVPIPEEMKVWHGDDWLFIKPKKQNYELTNWEMLGMSSRTSGLPEFVDIIKNDTEQWNTHI